MKHNIKRIRRFLDDIQWMFELNGFEKYLIDVKEQPEDQDLLAAQIVPEMTYKEITIKLYPHFWDLTKDLQRKALLHELVHTILQETKMISIGLLQGELHTEKEIKNINEKATSFVTSIIDNLFRGNLRYAKRSYK